MNRVTMMFIVLAVTGGCMTVEPDPISESPKGFLPGSLSQTPSGTTTKTLGLSYIDSKPSPSPAAPEGWARSYGNSTYGGYSYTTGSWSNPPKSKLAADTRSSASSTPNATAAKPAPSRPVAAKANKNDDTIVKTVYTETKTVTEKPASRSSPAKPAAEKPSGQTKPTPAETESPPVELGILRLINSKRIVVRYEVKDPAATGVAELEVWGTTDLHTWKKYDVAKRLKSSLVVDVQSEGLYGFRVVARAKGDSTKNQPPVGELPQMWVAVDLTKPVVQLLGTETNGKERTPSMVIRWNAKDRNLCPRPITLFYAEHPEGPWSPIAANLENSGRYEWFISSCVPANVCVRVEAADLMGNIGMVQSAPIHIPVWSPVAAKPGDSALSQPPPFTRSLSPPYLTTTQPKAPRPPSPTVSILSVEGQ